jgi:hypothetical protein
MSNTFRRNHDVREYTRLGAPTARRIWVISAVLTVGPLLPIAVSQLSFVSSMTRIDALTASIS